MPPLLQLQDISLSFGGAPLLAGAELSAAPGERLALVGRNGSGKSTLLKIAAGLVEADRGRRFLQPGARVCYLAQEPDLSAFDSAAAYVTEGLNPGAAHRGRMFLSQLGVDEMAAPAALSGGETRRAALAKSLAPEPDLLLLDEPTNHLDLPGIEWLETELSRFKGALVLISHDRRFLERLSRITVWLDRGVTRRLEQGFAAFEDWRDTVLEQEEAERHKLNRQIVREEHWLRYGVTARRKRNVRRLADLGALRQRARTWRGALGTAKMAAGAAEMSGALMIEADGVSKAWGGFQAVKDFSLRVARGERIGIAGANGAGKTTLLNLLTGALAPDSGQVKRGATVEMVTLDQKRASLAPDVTLADALTGGGTDLVNVRGQMRHVTGYMKDFLFLPEQARMAAGALSGGERGRLILARALAAKSNLLVLDEPTNDLDLETLDLLQDMLADYDGTVLLVSHDRDFLDRVASSMLMPEGGGRWQIYAGGYSDMVAQRGSGVAAKTAPAKAPVARGDTPPLSAPAARPRKLSFKEKHALETLPAAISVRQAEIAKLQAKLADPQLYARDRAAFDAAGQALAIAESALAADEERWLELEMLRESLEG